MIGIPKGPRVCIGEMEYRAIGLLSRCNFRRGGWDKGFVDSMADIKARGVMWISPKQREHLWRLVSLYAKQIGDPLIIEHAGKQRQPQKDGGEECPSERDVRVTG